MSAVADALGACSLFASVPESLREELGRLMKRVAYEPGEYVFRQGDPGHHLVVLERGKLEALLAVPGGPPLPLSPVLAGDVVGELSLLGDGRRTATVRAIEASTGWVLERAAFDVLRHDLRRPGIAMARAIGRRAVERLNALYRRSASELAGDPVLAARAIDTRWTPATLPDAAYTLTTLFFRDMSEPELEAIVEGTRCVDLPQGAVLELAGEPPAALWIVLRGAVETTLRGAEEARRLRLAGPGRAVGHLGLLDGHVFVDRRESRARERAIVLELPWPRVHELLRGDDPASRRFTDALWTDTVRALQDGERPLARMSAHRTALQLTGATPEA